MHKLTFNNKNYPIKTIQTILFGTVKVSVASLNDELMGGNGGYRTEEARLLDEQIFFYIDDSEIEKSSEDIRKHLEAELC